MNDAESRGAMDEDEVEEDDVPADFFDDFSNKEFLDGLDVLDEWEDADKQKKEAAASKRESEERRRRRSSDGRRHRSRSRSGCDETRRDPSKTKRDIQRDKIKCAKDKEAKIISEKLRVVETGLVPPGMEMDFDLNEIKAGESRPPKRQFSASPSPVRTKRRYVPPPLHRRRPSPERRYRRPSRSPVRYRNRSSERRERRSGKTSFLEELDHKLSIRAERDKLRDIQEKINGVSVKYNPAPPRPVPAPAPQYQPPVYDQQFFIGSQDMRFAPVPQPLPVYPAMPAPYYQPEPQSVLHSEDVQKLFYDDNISLTNFLNITARSDVSKTIDIKYKVAVIARCQDAIKLMTENAKPSGCFFYRKAIRAPERQADGAENASPLKREPTVRFQFTSRRAGGRETATTPLERLLCKLGVRPEPPKEATVAAPEAPPAAAAPPPPPGRHDPLRPNVLMKMVQTDLGCEECERRAAVRTASVGSQCDSAATASVDFGCQVSEDDFLNTARSALKNILKNQSLAALTPAQILAQLGSKAEEKKEVFPAARKIPDEPAPAAANNNSFPAPGPRPYNPRPPYYQPNYGFARQPHPFFNPGPRRF